MSSTWCLVSNGRVRIVNEHGMRRCQRLPEWTHSVDPTRPLSMASSAVPPKTRRKTRTTDRRAASTVLNDGRRWPRGVTHPHSRARACAACSGGNCPCSLGLAPHHRSRL